MKPQAEQLMKGSNMKVPWLYEASYNSQPHISSFLDAPRHFRKGSLMH